MVGEFRRTGAGSSDHHRRKRKAPGSRIYLVLVVMDAVVLVTVAMVATTVVVSVVVHSCHGELCRPRASLIDRMGLIVSDDKPRRVISVKKVSLREQMISGVLYLLPQVLVFIHVGFGVLPLGLMDGGGRREKERTER